MGSTGAPTLIGGAAGPANSWAKGRLTIVPASFTMSASYATGGDTVTLPSDAKGMELVAIDVLTPFPAPGTDRMFSWNGDAAAPKIGAKVISTGAEVANTTDLSATTLDVLFYFQT